MKDNCYIIVSAAISIDGFLDDSSQNRLILSNAQDLTELDKIRADVDGILVGANTIRTDNPHLIVRTQNIPVTNKKNPVRITLTKSGNLDVYSHFFKKEKDRGNSIVYASEEVSEQLSQKLSDTALVLPLPSNQDTAQFVIKDLRNRGINRILIEGGDNIFTLFLESGLVNYIRLAIAPIILGGQGHPKFLSSISRPTKSTNRFTLSKVEKISDMVVAWYKL